MTDPKPKPKAPRKRPKPGSGRDARPRGKLTTTQVIDAMRASAGIAAHAAERLKVSRSTVCKFLKDHPEINEQIEEILDTRVDMAEGKLFVAISKGEFPAIRYFLDNKGGKAGYGITRHEITGKNGGPIQLRDVSHYTDAELAILEQAAIALAGGAEGDGVGPEAVIGILPGGTAKTGAD